MAKKLSADQIQEFKAMKSASKLDAQEGMKKFANEVQKSRKQYKTEKEIKDVIKKQKKVISERGICLLSDVASIIGWEKGKDTPKRNELWKLTNVMATSDSADQTSVNKIFFDAAAKLLIEDYEWPIEAFLSKKEARKAKKRKNVEEKYGESPAVRRAPKSSDEKKIASRIRRLKRKAKEENISLEDYKKKYGYNDEGLKE